MLIGLRVAAKAKFSSSNISLLIRMSRLLVLLASALADKLVEIPMSGEVTLEIPDTDAALGKIYARRLIGWAGARENYTYACVNETWWQETMQRDTSIPDEFERERAFVAHLDDDDDDFTPAAHPCVREDLLTWRRPHHPHPHHPHHPQ